MALEDPQFAAQTRGAAPIDFRYRRLGYLAMNVTDIEKTTRFVTDTFGLDFAGEGNDGSRFFRIGTGHHDIVLTQAPTAAFVRAGWELETQADLDRAFAHYTRLGLSPEWVPAAEAAGLALERAFRVAEPLLGTIWEYYAGMSYTSVPRSNLMTRFQGGKHYGLVVPNCREMTDYMVKNMGFLVSDHAESWNASLLRAWPNPNHHSFAPLQFPAPRPSFHHVAFMVEEIDDIGRLMNRVKAHGVQVQFGIGRHTTSGSIHLYVYDPDHFIWEYTLGMEQFPETDAREPRRMSGDPRNFDLWQAVPDLEHVGNLPGVVQV